MQECKPLGKKSTSVINEINPYYYNSKIGCYYFFYDCIVNIDVIGSGCNT